MPTCPEDPGPVASRPRKVVGRLRDEDLLRRLEHL